MSRLINGRWCRYSNTLLVSLNNRIALRDSEVSPGGGTLLAFQTRPTPTAKDGPSIVHLEIENSPVPYTFDERQRPGELVKPEDVGRDRVTGKCFGAFFLVLFQYLDLINKYRMIRILNAKTPWTTIRTTGSILYFCTETFHSINLLLIRLWKKLFKVPLNTNYLCSLSWFAA